MYMCLRELAAALQKLVSCANSWSAAEECNGPAAFPLYDAAI